MLEFFFFFFFNKIEKTFWDNDNLFEDVWHIYLQPKVWFDIS